MPTRVLLEGPEIEPLLAQVREEYGSAARIVNAEKVRVGGVGGFFAREHFELSVEVPDDMARPSGTTATTTPSAGGTGWSPLPAWGAAVPGGAATTDGPATPDGRGEAAPRSLDDLLELAEAQEGQPSVTAAATPGTPSAAAATPAATTAAAAMPRPATVTPTTPATTTSATATPAWTAAATATPSPATAARPTPTAATGTRVTAPSATAGPAAPASATPTTPAPVAGTAAATTAGPAARPVVTPASGIPLKRPVRSTPGVPRASRVSTTGSAFAEVMAELNTSNVTQPGATVALRPHHAPAVATPAAATPAVATPAPVVARLVDLGVPQPLAARVTGTDPYQEVLEALAALPAPPRAPRRAGDVLVIAGELAHALPIARETAQGMHLDPARILLAAPTTGGTGLHASRRISGPAEAHRRARALHRAEVPHVVVIDAPVTMPDDGWVRSICDALGATAVWAAVDATRKVADTARHLHLMGRVDATAVYATAVCSDPAAVLALEPPVALLERRPATPAAWATLLTERLRRPAAQITDRMEATYVTR